MTAPQGSMRIAELSRRTGVSRETIHYYLREGLLPPARKVGRNMSYYDDAHVETLRLIKRLQQEKFLPLSVIRKLLKGGRVFGGVQDLELAAEVFRSSAEAPGGRALRPVGRAAFARAAGLSEEQAAALQTDGLLAPDTDGPGPPEYGPHDLAVAEIFKGLLGAGIGDDDARGHLRLCARHIGALVREESRRFIGALVHRRDPTAAAGAVRATRDLLGRFLAVARERSLQQQVEALLRDVQQVTSPGEATPRLLLSEQALRRTRAEATLARLRRQAGTPAGSEALAAFLFRIGRADEVLAFTQGAPGSPRLAAYSGHALAVTGKPGEGGELLAAAVQARPDDLLIRVLHGRVQLVQAREAARGAPGDTLSLVFDGLRALERSEACTAEGDDRLWALLARGRLRAAVPDFFQQRAAAVRDLSAVLEAVDARSTAPDAAALRLEGLAAFTLGGVLLEQGDVSSARTLLARAAAADPDGEVARQARRRLEEAGE